MRNVECRARNARKIRNAELGIRSEEGNAVGGAKMAKKTPRHGFPSRGAVIIMLLFWRDF